jgi:hypothetical protein
MAEGNKALINGTNSILQIFGEALNTAQIQYKSNCTDAAKFMSSVCPTGFVFYDNTCISVKHRLHLPTKSI